jgi:hypothetical protein
MKANGGILDKKNIGGKGNIKDTEYRQLFPETQL